jgi:hypothetical protein
MSPSSNDPEGSFLFGTLDCSINFVITHMHSPLAKLFLSAIANVVVAICGSIGWVWLVFQISQYY